MTFFLAILLPVFHFVNSPVTTLRECPFPESEVVSQAYYSEQVNILEEQNDWVKIETTVDHYQGWTLRNSIYACTNSRLLNPSSTIIKVKRCAAHVYSVRDTIYGPIITLPFDSKLELIDEKDSRWMEVALVDGRHGYIQSGDVSQSNELLNRDQMCCFSMQFFGLPYTWGGRSSFGYDCSGFVQMLYRQMGIYLPRDSKDQARWKGFVNVEIEELNPGDLIFFGYSENKICHVGLYLGEDHFIHASFAENTPYICVSQLSNPEWNGSGEYPFRTARTLSK